MEATEKVTEHGSERRKKKWKAWIISMSSCFGPPPAQVDAVGRINGEEKKERRRKKKKWKFWTKRPARGGVCVSEEVNNGELPAEPTATRLLDRIEEDSEQQSSVEILVTAKENTNPKGSGSNLPRGLDSGPHITTGYCSEPRPISIASQITGSHRACDSPSSSLTLLNPFPGECRRWGSDVIGSAGVVVLLLSMITGGRVFAIICTCAWLYSVQSLRHHRP